MIFARHARLIRVRKGQCRIDDAAQRNWVRYACEHREFLWRYGSRNKMLNLTYAQMQGTLPFTQFACLSLRNLRMNTGTKRRVMSLIVGIVSAIVAAPSIAADEKAIQSSPAGIEKAQQWGKLPDLRKRTINARAQGLPDLVAIATTESNPCHVALQIRNNGLGPIPEAAWHSAQVRVQLWDIFTATLLEDGTIDLWRLPGAATLRHRNGKTEEIRYDIPRGAFQQVRLMVDVTDSVIELDDSNNIASALGVCR